MRQIRVVIGATTIGPNLLTAAERPSMRAIANRLFNCGLLSTFFEAIWQSSSARPDGAGRGCADGASAAGGSIASS